MVLYWVVIFTGLRAAVMEYILMPLAKKAKVVTKRDQTRFSEQAWLLVYYSIFWTLGMVMRSVTLQNDTLLTIAVYLS
jgi:acyl-CoA-dependent ceramide synthase